MADGAEPQHQPASEIASRPAAPAPQAAPLAPSYQQVLALQRSAGNAAVARALANARTEGLGVRASDPLWYFNGERQREHPTEIKLAAETRAASRLVWDVVEGQDRVELGGSGGPGHAESQNDNSVNVLSRSGSEGSDDVRVRVSQYGDDGALLGVGENAFGVRTPAGTRHVETTTTPVAMPVGEDGPAKGTGLEERDEQGNPVGGETAAAPAEGEAPAAAPKSMRHVGTSHNADATWGYLTHETYEVLDDRGTPINGFDVNEKWPEASPTNDHATTDWRRGPAGGHHSGTTRFSDMMGGEASGRTPAPQAPQTPLGTTQVQHWNQEWYIGSTTPGSGTLVQKNRFRKFRDHAVHENIQSPP